MSFKEFNKLRDEMMVIQEIDKWVCDFQQQSILGKPLRNVAPIKVKVIRNQKYLDIYSKLVEKGIKKSEAHTRHDLWSHHPFNMYEYTKLGKLTKTEVDFFGGVGTNGGVHVFDDEASCINKYNELVYKSIKDAELEKHKTLLTMEDNIEKLKEQFVNSDYVMEKLSRE